MTEMKRIRELALRPDEAALWRLGQASCLVKGPGATVAIDPYLTDSAGALDPAFSRLLPVPIEPEDLEVEVLVTTHNHLDHLDPETLRRYGHSQTTWFVAPHLAATALAEVGIPAERIRIIDVGDRVEVAGVWISGCYAVPTGADVLDTTGYRLEFANGRTLYDASDTAFSPLLLEAAPEAEVLLAPINGKWGNLGPEQAAELAARVRPRYAVPNHYDLFALNRENPESFRHFHAARCEEGECVILPVLEPLIWGDRRGPRR